MRRSNTLRCDEAAFPDSPFYGRSRWPKHYIGKLFSTAKDFDISLASAFESAARHHRCIAIDKEILGGTPRIAGTRIPIYMILDAIEYYGSLEGALTSYPHLSLEQVREAVSFAGEVLEHSVDNESETSVR
jgi:uncharacterized protein (DUF433 family)